MEIPDSASKEEIRQEIALFLGDSPAMVTLGGIMRLAADGSPLVCGGEITDTDLRRMMIAFNIPGAAEDVEEATSQLAAALRAAAIIRGEKSGTESPAAFSPEWLADTISAVAQVLPASTLEDILWKYPAATCFHLAAALHRRNGGRTSRVSEEDLASKLREINNNETEA